MRIAFREGPLDRREQTAALARDVPPAPQMSGSAMPLWELRTQRLPKVPAEIPQTRLMARSIVLRSQAKNAPPQLALNLGTSPARNWRIPHPPANSPGRRRHRLLRAW